MFRTTEAYLLSSSPTMCLLALGVVLLGPLGSDWRGPSSWSAWLSRGSFFSV